jgi:uncharacterized protein (DUF885 family)
LQDELQTMKEVLLQETARQAPGLTWLEAKRLIPFVDVEGQGLLDLYGRELERMELHCRQHGLVPDKRMKSAVLEVSAVPESLAAIRASDSYASTPGHPPSGGVFFVLEHGLNCGGQFGRSLEYRMTAAHEAWPGYHLLDSCRWALDRPLRRPLESPLFYEGWACLAEELMARTGYFNGPWDRFLLAKRRVERAARGLIDLGLQGGRMTIDQAVELLVGVGYRREVASSVIPKYLLRPGYQVCYSFGLMQALNLLDKYGNNAVGTFSRTLLTQGEIGFDRLEKTLVVNCDRQA